MMLDSQGRLAPIDTKASPISNYRKVRQRRWLGDIGCVSSVNFIEIQEATKY